MQHFGDAAAVGRAAVPGRANQIRVRRHVIGAAVQQNAAGLELFERQLRVVAEQHDADLIPKLLRHMQPREPELVFERFGAADVIDGIRQIPPLQIADRRIRAGEEIIGEGLDAEPGHFCDIGVRAAGGVVGQKQVSPAAFPHVPQKILRAVKERFAQVDRAVHIQQEQPFFRKGHQVPPVIKIPYHYTVFPAI